MTDNHYDIVVVGGGPAGLQATLILARLRKKILVFDAPEPPRNGASHGVHNFLGMDGLLPAEIRELAWQQINVYNSAELRMERVVDVQAHEAGFIMSGETGSFVTARHVILAMGYRDIYPDIPGFMECWGDTIIACPYCDGYENRDRVWGLVTFSQLALEHLPKIYRNWTSQAKIILTSQAILDEATRAELIAQGISIHEGEILEVHHKDGKVQAITLTGGEQISVETLFWRPPEQVLPLTQKVIANFQLELDENGYIKTDATSQTSAKGLWAAGDIRGWASALWAAHAGSLAAYTIAQNWYTNHTSG